MQNPSDLSLLCVSQKLQTGRKGNHRDLDTVEVCQSTIHERTAEIKTNHSARRTKTVHCKMIVIMQEGGGTGSGF